MSRPLSLSLSSSAPGDDAVPAAYDDDGKS